MAIKAKARILLELGAELISSDQIAIYELVKNSLDAGATRTEIEIHVVLQKSDHLNLLQSIKDAKKRDGKLPGRQQIAARLDQLLDTGVPVEERQAYVAAATGPEAILDPIEALEHAYRKFNWIEVRDNGVGMSMSDLEGVYLTVGTPNRYVQRQSSDTTILGEKGIGRLSVVRLGDQLEVKTSKQGESRLNTLNLDWSVIKSNPEMNLDEFPAQPRPGPKKPKPELQGTSIWIGNLSSDWSVEKLEGLAKTDFAKLFDPFLTRHKRPNIRLYFNGEEVDIPAFESRQLTFAQASCTAQFSYRADGTPFLTGEVFYKTYSRRKAFTLEGTHLRSTLALKGTRPKKNQSAELPGSLVHGLANLGPFEMEAHWFNRQKLRLDQPDGYEDALQWLTRWGGGLLLYRDHFRVYPYAETRDDWLDLDGIALATSGYKMNRKQLVGAVRISARANPRLLDQTNREGLRDTDEKAALLALLRYILITEFKSFLNSVEGEQGESAVKEFPKLERRLEESQKIALKQVQYLRQKVTDKEDIAAINVLLAKMADMSEAWERSKSAVRRYEEDLDTYVHLAGVGLMTEFIFHELARISDRALTVLKDYKASTSKEGAKLRTLRDQLVTLDKRIRILDPLSTPGRQRKESFDLMRLLRDIADAHQAQFQRHEITWDLSELPMRTVEIKAVRGQIVQIIENFISNSVYWLKQEAETRSFKPVVSMAFDSSTKTLNFLDNGPGISEDRGEEVFNAFFTTKPAGEGRGLGLYIARRLADSNGLTIDLGPVDRNRLHHGFIVKFSG
jgi:signal transduction histidine kinase